jgi:hypothetical protein
MYILDTKSFIIMFTYINYGNGLKSVFVHINSMAAYQKYAGSSTIQRNKTEKTVIKSQFTFPGAKVMFSHVTYIYI